MTHRFVSRLLASSLIAFAAMAAPSFAEVPGGAYDTGCDVNAFVAVRSQRTGDVLYWNNATCKAGGGGGQMPVNSHGDNGGPYNNGGHGGGHGGGGWGGESSHSSANGGGAHAGAQMGG